MNIYGDRGNILCLSGRCRERGIDFQVTDLELGDDLRPKDYDLVFLGGAQDREQRRVAADLAAGKGEALREAAEDDAVVPAVCGGYQLLGNYYRPAQGEDLPGAGLLDIRTHHPGPGEARLIGNVVLRWNGGTLVGFENHGGRTYLGAGAKPLGRVIKGSGNNGEDGGEGAVYRNVFATYLHGPLLPKNPVFADHILATALRRRHADIELRPLDDSLELRAHAVAARLPR